MNRKSLLIFAALAGILFAILFRQCGRSRVEPIASVPVSTSTETATLPVAVTPAPTPTPAPLPISIPTPEKKKNPIVAHPAAGPATLAPPAIKLFPELIPKNIEIVRVYYTSMISGPASSIQFDINGSGFTKEFEKMITVESGQPEVAVKNLALVTPNQIHGTLEISEKTPTVLSFPRVLIQGKVVFQAPEPFAVIRPGEVLNLIFTEMGESGRTGRFRVFTNLTPEMFSNFQVSVNTPTIRISDLAPTYPFVVDGTITIGPAVGGNYDIDVTLAGKNICHKAGIVRVVRPNVGQSGLIQKTSPFDGFHRPGDKARFAIQGSGFQPQDVSVLQASVAGVTGLNGVFTYMSPGRLELEISLPPAIATGTYTMTLASGKDVLQTVPNAFEVVDKNWTRALKLTPELTPGTSSTLTLSGRDLDADFVSRLKVEVDEPALKLSAFSFVNAREATLAILAGPDVQPGDYLLKITANGKPVSPAYGSIIQVGTRRQ